MHGINYFTCLNIVIVGARRLVPDTGPMPICCPWAHIAIRSNEHGLGDRWTRFTRNEQLTMVTLWSIFRSPLMFGGELRDNDI